MKFSKEKKKNNLIKKSIFLIMIVLCFTFISSVSAETYNIYSDLNNDDIQSIIDNSNSGDTINFEDSSYNDVSLVIDKKLNVVSGNNIVSNGSSINDNVSSSGQSNSGTVIHTSSSISSKAETMGVMKSFGFYFTKNSVCSILSGFTFLGNSDYLVILNGTSDVNLINNTFEGGNDGGILIENSTFSTLNNNTIKNINGNGVFVQDSSSINISYNSIQNNSRSGIHLSNTKNVNIHYNNISYNSFNGISLYDDTKNTLINNNIIFHNLNGVYVNSKTKNDTITANTIYDNRVNPSSELGSFETGNGVLIGPNFEKTSNSNLINVYYNTILNNEGYGIKNNPSFTPMTVGPNWYGSNDASQSFVCPLILGKLLETNLFSTANSIGIQFTDNSKVVADVGESNVKFMVDGKEYTASVKDGKAVLDIKLDPNTSHKIEAIVGNQNLVKEIEKQTTTNSNSNSNQNININDFTSQLNNINNQNSNNQNTQNQGTNDGTSEGNSNINGLNSGKSNGTSSGSGYGSGESKNNATYSGSDVGENGDYKTNDQGSESSSGQSSSKSFELDTKSITKSITQNSPLIIACLLLCVLIFAVGYRRKNKFN